MNQFTIEDFENLVLKEAIENEQLKQQEYRQQITQQSIKVSQEQNDNQIIIKEENEKQINQTKNLRKKLSIEKIIQIQIIPTVQIQRQTQEKKQQTIHIIEEQFENLNQNNNQTGVWSSLEKKAGFPIDPLLDVKQKLFSQLYILLNQIGVKAQQKKHSILEDVLQLCIMYLPEIRGENKKLFNEKLYEEFKEKFKLQRTFEAFKRRFHHLALFSNNWTIENIKMIQQLLIDNNDISFDNYCIVYDIQKKNIKLPSLTKTKQGEKNQKLIQQIIEQSEKKKIVLSITTKTLTQFININPKEIDEDVQEFEDEIQFIEMILKLISLIQQD